MMQRVALEVRAFFGFIGPPCNERLRVRRGKGRQGRQGRWHRDSVWRNVQADWLGDLSAKVLGQPGAACFLMMSIETTVSKVFVLPLEQVPNVV